jgi:signal transduction histidine kinase
MNHLEQFTDQVRNRLVGILFINNLFVIADWWIAEHLFQLNGYQLLATLAVASILSLTILPWFSVRYFTEPTRLIWQAILHIAPDTANTPAPDLKHARLGRELVTNLISHVYQLASVADNVEKLARKRAPDLKADFVANSMPLPLIVLDKAENIVFANEAMLSYIKRPEEELIGQSVYSTIDLSFTNDHTFTRWLKHAEAFQVTASQSWERVRMSLPDSTTSRQFDMAAYYNKNNPQGFETMLVFFDHSDQYSHDDQAMSFVALAVHELRTPLTLLRGYIEVFEEELGGKVDDELQDFMRKMSASAQQLSAFVNNILNVARVEDDQLVLQLHKEDWGTLLKAAVTDMSLRAEVRGIKLELQLDAKLPPVAVDRVSIYEVIDNIIDNAIKYSGTSKKIVIRTYETQDGMVETIVQDFGVGIPQTAITNIFEKFYRHYRNRAQIGGTGLGLYLSKSIVTAHHGNLWVRSKEGEGATFGFTLQPYAQLADDQKNGETTGIVRNAHGWIKNHSMYRR